MDNFFNTIHLVGEDLAEARNKCNLQERRILEIFDISTGPMTPFDVQGLYEGCYCKVPITSIRRAMTCLTAKGFIRKTTTMKTGEYGMPNHTWEKI